MRDRAYSRLLQDGNAASRRSTLFARASLGSGRGNSPAGPRSGVGSSRSSLEPWDTRGTVGSSDFGYPFRAGTRCLCQRSIGLATPCGSSLKLFLNPMPKSVCLPQYKPYAGRRRARCVSAFGGALAASAIELGPEPASSGEAIAAVKTGSDRGARFLGIPHSELWWLDAYPGLQSYLEERCRRLVGYEDLGAIYDLTSSSGGVRRHLPGGSIRGSLMMGT